MYLVYRMRSRTGPSPTMREPQRNLVSIKRSFKLNAFPTLGRCAVLAMMLVGGAGLPAQEAEKPSETQEDSRAVRTREFLGLGRMPDAKMAAEGAKILGATCGFCHGADARGARVPDLLRSAVVLDDNQGELIGQTVPDGRQLK